MKKAMEILKSTKLEKCNGNFENNGCNDLDFIKSMNKVQLSDRRRIVGIYEKT